MYLCEYKYKPWHGQTEAFTTYSLRQNDPSKNHYIRKDGVKVRCVRNKDLALGTGVLIRYAKINHVLEWIYPKKKNNAKSRH